MQASIWQGHETFLPVSATTSHFSARPSLHFLPSSFLLPQPVIPAFLPVEPLGITFSKQTLNFRFAVKSSLPSSLVRKTPLTLISWLCNCILLILADSYQNLLSYCSSNSLPTMEYGSRGCYNCTFLDPPLSFHTSPTPLQSFASPIACYSV